MKKILVPIDFSDYSNNALRLATHIAKVKGMEIKLLHIIEEPILKVPFLNKDAEANNVDVEKNTLEHLQRLVTLEKANEIKVSYDVRKSKAGAAKEIMKEDCDLIVMGRRRIENDAVLLTGSVAEKVVRLSSIPVITVADLRMGFQINKIVFAADFDNDAEAIRPIIQRVVDLARIFHAELHFLYVLINRHLMTEAQSEEKAKEIIRKFNLEGNPLEVYFGGTPEDGITDYINNEEPDILALCTHGRRGIPHFFVGSVAENMSDYADIPVLTYNINEKKNRKKCQTYYQRKNRLGEKKLGKIIIHKFLAE